jgi:hypothetical protein
VISRLRFWVGGIIIRYRSGQEGSRSEDICFSFYSEWESRFWNHPRKDFDDASRDMS